MSFLFLVDLKDSFFFYIQRGDWDFFIFQYLNVGSIVLEKKKEEEEKTQHIINIIRISASMYSHFS